jgi:hypothetical protein
LLAVTLALAGVMETLAATGGVVVPDADMMTLKAAAALLPAASVTLKLKILVPALVGVPERVPAVDQPRPVLQGPEQEVIAQT